MTTSFSSGEEDSPPCFGDWLKHRRQELDLTQEQLAKRASCSVFAIRKIEMGERGGQAISRGGGSSFARTHLTLPCRKLQRSFSLSMIQAEP